MLQETLGFGQFNILPHLIAMSVAYLLALPIGWNREKEERSAGIRTFPLVAIASCGFIQAAEGLTGQSPEAMARIVEGIITGMGFIGGGAILHLKDIGQGHRNRRQLVGDRRDRRGGRARQCRCRDHAGAGRVRDALSAGPDQEIDRPSTCRGRS